MKWLVRGRDAEGRPRQMSLEAASEAAAQAHVRNLGWQSLDTLMPEVIEGQVVNDELAEGLPVTYDDPAIARLLERAAAEPSTWRQLALTVPAAYLATGKWGLIVPMGLAANLWFGGPTWMSWVLGGLLLLPAALTAAASRATTWYMDYRWALAKGDWATGLDRARKLSSVLEPNLAKCHEARALAGAGHLAQARRLLSEVEIGPKFTAADAALQRGLVLVAGHDYEGALAADLDVLSLSDDKAGAAQGVAIRLALDLRDGPSAKPYLEMALEGRNRGALVDAYLDFTEVIVQFECGEHEGLVPRIEALVPVLSAAGADLPETHGMDLILRAYACLLTARTDPTRAAEHYHACATYLGRMGRQPLLDQCAEALGLD